MNASTMLVRYNCLRAIVALSALLLSPPSTHAAAPAGYDTIAQPFIQQFCLECHGTKAKAGYRVDQIGVDFSAPAVAEHWKELLDRINAGEMPPRGSPRPNAQQFDTFVTWVNQQLQEVDRRAKNAGGRIPMRRLNRDEYVNTVRDLFKLDENSVRPLVDDLPADGAAEGFDRLGVALFFDQTQIERSLSVAAKIAQQVIVTEPPKTNKIVDRFEFTRRRPPADEIEVFPGFTHKIPRGAKDRVVHPNHVEFIQGGPTYSRELDGWGVVHHFGISTVVSRDGYYRFRIRAQVDNRSRTTPNKFRLFYSRNSPIQVEQEVPLDPSGVTEAVMFLRGPVNGEIKGPQVFTLCWNHNEKSVINHPDYKQLFSKWTGLRGRMEQAATRRAPPAEMDALKKERDALESVMNAHTGAMYIYNPEFDVERLPRLLLESIEVEGPIQKEWPPASHRALLFAGDERRDAGYVREVFAKLLPRAYRRPVQDDEIDAIVAVVNDAQTQGKLSFHEALRVGLQRVLCAPGFWFIEEPTGGATEPRRLKDHELATRLSYFLWSTMPDDELWQLAEQNKLHEPATLEAQLSRMLADPRSQQFVQNFAGQWLSVRDYGSIKPAAEYRDYDRSLELASQHEPLAFFAEVLQKNLPITSFIDSDFLVINERLARHYGIDGVSGSEFRRVSITPEQHRGGVLGMAGLMTYLADGTRTLPMRRGSWVLRQILNDPPNNPPPNAGEIQPNTAGKQLTVRERIELHRRDEVCASCHAKLDPFGLALENYDAIGKWRERFNGEGYQGNQGPRLDVSGEFPDGSKFTTLADYKAGLLAQRDKFARALSIKLLTYALGRPVGYADHGVVDALVNRLQKDEYRLQSLIRGIVECELFETK